MPISRSAAIGMTLKSRLAAGAMTAVTDEGKPALTSYRRIILHVRPGAS